MNSGGKFFKNKILNFSKRNSNEYQEDTYENEQEVMSDEEFFGEFFANTDTQNDEKAIKEELPMQEPVKKEEPAQAKNPIPTYDSSFKTSQQTANDTSYKYDFSKMNDYSSHSSYEKNEPVAKAPVAAPVPAKKVKATSYTAPQASSFAPKSSFEPTKQSKVYAIVLKSADDVRAVVDCMMEKKIVAIYVDMTILSKLDERRALDFIDGAKYVLKTNVKCISPKIYMVTPEFVSMDGDFMDFSEKHYEKAQGEFYF